MKFTEGYWQTKPEFDFNFAIQSFSGAIVGDALRVVCATVPINGRGDLLNHGTLTVTLTSPMADVIRVRVEHFMGEVDRGPHFELSESPVKPVITETEDAWTFQSGRAKATIHKARRGWRVTYAGDGRVLTESEYHGMAHAHHRQTGRDYMIDSLTLDVGERVYGLGERFTEYVKNGQVVDIWNGDGGTASEMAYKNVPFYMTNRGYGVLVEDASDVSFEVASEKVERVQFSLPGQKLTYDVIYGGTPKGVLERYTALTGRPALPPAWSFGLWLSTSFTTSYDEATVTSFIDGMAQRDIPLSVFHFDCFWMKENHLTDLTWDPDVFPDPAGLLKKLKARGLHICCWLNPYISQESDMFAEGMEKGYFIQKENGDVWQTDMWQPGTAIVDVTNPGARAWYVARLNKLMEMGVDCFKTDFGERIPVRGVKYFDGSDPLRMHNYYTYLYNQMVFGAIEAFKGEGDAVVFARSATVGGQKFPVHWNGDSSASYRSMAETLRSGLSIAHSGFGFWSHDIAGFEQTATADVYKRWAAFGLLSSHSRLHGSSSYRVPWLFDEEANAVVKKFARLKNRLMPYLYGAAVEAHEAGVPMLRPMLLEFPDSIACETCDRQYMLGASLLVAPVMHADNHADYYLPDGVWTNILTGEKATGDTWRRETHGFLSLPLMARPNSVIPMGACEEKPDYDYADGLELHVFEPQDGEITVTVPDVKGNVAARYVGRTANGETTVETDCKKPYKVIVHR